MSSNEGNQIKAILLDIEGTTTSISFVKDILFPYARQHVEDYLRKKWDDPETEIIVAALHKQSVQDVINDVPGANETAEYISPLVEDTLQSILENIYWQMNLDRKNTALKKLQGLVWQYGYDNGQLKGHIYPDVPAAFERWTKSGIKLYIYSSGSVQAQKLLFAHSEAGDLCKFLSGYFDTATGMKNETESYEKISKAVQLPAQEMLFCTDIVAEARAALKAGMHVRVMLRPGNKALEPSELQEFTTADNFENVP